MEYFYRHTPVNYRGKKDFPKFRIQFPVCNHLNNVSISKLPDQEFNVFEKKLYIIAVFGLCVLFWRDTAIFLENRYKVCIA